MDGNPGELLINLAASDFYPNRRQLVFRTYSAYSWGTLKPGNLKGYGRTCCVYDLKFTSDDYDYGVISAWNYCCCKLPRCCCLFEMIRSPDDAELWDRPSTICGMKMRYKFKRIARLEQGKFVPTHHMADFVAFAATVGPVSVMAPAGRSKKVAVAPLGGAPLAPHIASMDR